MVSTYFFAEKFVKQPMEDIVEFLQERMCDFPYNIDQMMDLLQESRFELKKGGLEIPPPPTRDEFPMLDPGSSLRRGVFETASARARKNRERGKIIVVPPGKQVLPPSPSEVNGTEPGGHSLARSSSGHQSEMSKMSTDSSVRYNESLGRSSRSVGNHSESSAGLSDSPSPHTQSIGISSESVGMSSGNIGILSENVERHSQIKEKSTESIGKRSQRRSDKHSESSGGRPHFPEVRYVSPEASVTSGESQQRIRVEEPYNPQVKIPDPSPQQHPTTPSGTDSLQSRSRVATSLTSEEIAKFNQDLKNSYIRSQKQLLKTHSGRRQNGSRSVPLEKMTATSPVSQFSDNEPGELRRNPESMSMVINLPGSVSIDRIHGTGNSPPVVQTPNGTSILGHAPVWHRDGPEGTKQYTLTQSPNRQMTFV